MRLLFPSPLRLLFSRVVLIVMVVLFALVTWQVASEGAVYRADGRLGSVLRDGLPEATGQALADLGNITVAVPVLALTAAWAAVRGHRRALHRWWLPPLAAALVMAVVPAVVAPLKALVSRPGPPGAGPGGYFPSGHAATAAVAFGAAALLLLPVLHGRVLRLLLGAGVLLLNVAVGAGLVSRGYHWPLDVLASWLLSGVLLAPVAHSVRTAEIRSGQDRRGADSSVSDS